MQQPGVCIEVRDLSKSYKNGRVQALDSVNLAVYAGEVLGLIGPNGAGKSTLFGCLLGLLRPDAGSVHFDGKPVDYLSVRRITGYVPERPDFEQWMTGRLFLEYHHMLSRCDPSTMAATVEECLTTVELDPAVWGRRLGTYSRGMLQRLNLAQLLVGKPRILLLDEPTLGLDPVGVKIVRKVIRSFRQSGVTAIINSHQLDEIERECDRVAFLRQGKVEKIENLKGSVSGPHVLFLRWTETGSEGQHSSLVRSLAQSMGVTVQEANRSWARVGVAGGEQAARLIREVVAAGVPVEEAVAERARLEKLFESEPGSQGQ